jgi:hypothetical protein
MDDRIKRYQQWLGSITQDEIELVDAQQQRIMLLEQSKILYQQLFGQSLESDPELEFINSEIARLKKYQRQVYDVIQAASSVPRPIVVEKDWSKYLFYSQTLRKIVNAQTPFEQYNLYMYFTVGMYLGLRSIFRSHHALKAVKFAPGTDDRCFHSYLAGATSEELVYAKKYAHRIRVKGILGGLLVPICYITYLQIKY